MMKVLRILAMAAVMIACLSCGKNRKVASVDGVWELESIETRSVQIGDAEISVYLKLDSGRFDIYQKVGAGRYRHFDGTYIYSEGKLSGKYSDGKPLGSIYDVETGNGRLILFTAGSLEKDIYVKVDSIPDNVLEDII